jgi:hypothetical protein
MINPPLAFYPPAIKYKSAVITLAQASTACRDSYVSLLRSRLGASLDTTPVRYPRSRRD